MSSVEIFKLVKGHFSTIKFVALSLKETLDFGRFPPRVTHSQATGIFHSLQMASENSLGVLVYSVYFRGMMLDRNWCTWDAQNRTNW